MNNRITSFRANSNTQINIRGSEMCMWSTGHSTIGFHSERQIKEQSCKKESLEFSNKIFDIPHYKIKIEKVHILPLELFNIGEAINYSRNILELPNDWDEMGAKQIDKQTWVNASLFIIDYSTYVFKNFNIIIQQPTINPGLDGSIDLSWRTLKARFLINIKPIGAAKFASYYGDLYDNNQSIKNSLDSLLLIDHLAYWMKNLS